MLVVLVLLLQWTSGVLTQGVFAPPEFDEASCAGSNKWTTWFDSGDPSSTLGEFEVTNHIQQIFPSFMCPTPIAIEVIIFILIIEKLKNILGSYYK
jgi:hypothetical protein